MVKKAIGNISGLIRSGSQRSVRAKKNILGIFVTRGLSILLNLLIVSITISYVSSYKYGIWLTITSLVSWLSFFDIGLGNGLKNKFAEAVSLGKIKLARIYVSSTYAVFTIVILSVWLIVSSVSINLNWAKIFALHESLNSELRVVILIAIANFAFQFILKLVTTLLHAIQRPALSSLFDTTSQLFVLVLILILKKITGDGSLIHLSLIFTFSYIFVLLVGSVWAFKTVLKQYAPSFKLVKIKYVRNILPLGLKFFLLQIIGIVFYQTNNIVITRMLGPTEVTVYNVAFKYMQTISIVFMVVLTPFWSAFTEAMTTGDYPWMKRATRKLQQMFIYLGILGLVMVIASPVLYQWWIGDKVQIPFVITVLMFVFHMFHSWSTLYTQLLAGLGKIKLQLIFSSLAGVLYLPVVIFMCGRFGLNGILYGNILILLLLNSWFGPVQINKILNKRAHGIWDK